MLLSNAKVIIILIIFYIKKKRGMITIFPQKKKKNIVILFQDGKPCGAEVQKLKNREFHMPLNFVPYN